MKWHWRAIYLLPMVLCFQKHLCSQQTDSTYQTIRASVALGTVLSTHADEAPFWFTANQSQRYAQDPQSAFFNVNLQHSPLQFNSGQVGYHLEYQVNVARNSNHNLINGHVFANWGKWSFFGGRKEEVLGKRDTLLSNSIIVNGNNSLPVPKVAIYTNDWLALPLTEGWLEMRFYMSHGWLEKDRLVESPYLHQKHLYLTLGRKYWKVSPYFGVQHNAFWGGFLTTEQVNLSASFRDYLRVFSGARGSMSANPGDFNNALGDHFGIIDMGFDLDFKTWRLLQYIHIPFEDGSGLDIRNFNSGLLGFSLRKKSRGILEGLTIEYLNTQEQDGRKIRNGQPFYEPENYFNNFLYRSGWSYQGVSLGNAMYLIPDTGDLTWRRISNTVESIQLAASGRISGVPYQLAYRYFENNGNIYDIEDGIAEPLHSHSLQATVNLINGKVNVEASLIHQWGDLENTGLFLRVVRPLF